MFLIHLDNWIIWPKLSNPQMIQWPLKKPCVGQLHRYANHKTWPQKDDKKAHTTYRITPPILTDWFQYEANQDAWSLTPHLFLSISLFAVLSAHASGEQNKKIFGHGTRLQKQTTCKSFLKRRFHICGCDWRWMLYFITRWLK